jgi:hypothetical protein
MRKQPRKRCAECGRFMRRVSERQIWLCECGHWWAPSYDELLEAIAAKCSEGTEC